MLCHMPAITSDGKASAEAITTDGIRGDFPRLTPAAVDRAMTRLSVSTIAGLQVRLGFSDMTFWRVRRGMYDIPYSHALRISRLIGWPLSRCFDNVGGTDA
jgi:hypothetical protein